ncbi:MAG: hypothetical protein RIQ81_287 [Pseudomonadota bacterium]
MNHQTRQSIPVANLQDYLSADPARRRKFIDTVGSALQDIGFFALENHGVDAGLIDRAYGLTQQFFELPEATKKSYERLDWHGQRGFTSFGREHAKDSKAPDLKEFWHVGREQWQRPATTADARLSNLWPAELPEFKRIMLDLYSAMDRCSFSILEACAEYLDEPKDRFTSIAEDGDTILRVIHYPPVAPGVDPASVRAAAHEDINLITLLCEATAGGLELLQRDGTWRPVHALRGQIIVDSGDMIQNMTNGVLKSTTHRVVNPDNSRDRRFSMPFFVHPRGEASLNPLPGCVKRQGGKKLYPEITAGDYLAQRLREIGLTK